MKVYDGPRAGETFTIKPDRNSIYFGRHNTCEIQIEDALLSKFQATLQYKKKEGWVIADGNLENKTHSTNGTWLYLADDYRITQGMIFKANSTLFEVTLI